MLGFIDDRPVGKGRMALRATAVLGAGLLLGVGGPKRLTLVLLAAATIAGAGLSTTTEYSLLGLYVAIATVLVWLPVLLALLFGSHATEWTAACEAWWHTHRATAAFVPLVVLGAYFLTVGVVGLASL